MRQVLEQKTTLAAASGVLIIMAICGLVCLMGKTCHEEKRKKKNSLSPRTHSVKSTPAVSTTSITALTVNWPQEIKKWPPKILSIKNLRQNQDQCGHLTLKINWSNQHHQSQLERQLQLTVNWLQETNRWPLKILSIKNLWQDQQNSI